MAVARTMRRISIKTTEACRARIRSEASFRELGEAFLNPVARSSLGHLRDHRPP